MVVFLIFITKSLDVVVAIHPPGKDQPAWMCPASQWSSKVGFFPVFTPSILSLHVISPFSFCFTPRGQEARAATLCHWDHAMVVLTTLYRTFISQCHLLETRARLTQTSSRTHHQLWPCLGLERSVGVAPHLGGLQPVWPILLW